jgi:hypothetical protein
LWTIIEREDLTKVGAIIFATTHAAVVRGVALWLRKVPIDPLPPMFFRFTSQFAETPRPADSKLAIPYRLAAKDLSTRAGQERVFFLVNGTSMRRAVARICARRSFMVPMSKYLDGASPDLRAPGSPTVYIHVNRRIGALSGTVGDIIRRIRLGVRNAKFIIKFTYEGCLHGEAAALPRGSASLIEVLPPSRISSNI